MNNSNENQRPMKDEYDFSGGVRGKYAHRYSQGSNVVVLDPDVASEFRSAEAVNEVLRGELLRRRGKAAG